MNQLRRRREGVTTPLRRKKRNGTCKPLDELDRRCSTATTFGRAQRTTRPITDTTTSSGPSCSPEILSWRTTRFHSHLRTEGCHLSVCGTDSWCKPIRYGAAPLFVPLLGEGPFWDAWKEEEEEEERKEEERQGKRGGRGGDEKRRGQMGQA